MTLPGPSDPHAPWDLEFERLKFVDAAGADAAATDAAPVAADLPAAKPAIDPRTLPADTVPRRGVDLGRPAVRRGAGHSREAGGRRQPQGADGDERELWRERHGRLARQRRAASRASITSYDVGETLKRLGFAAVLEAKSGDLEFDLNWPGAPTDDPLAHGHGPRAGGARQGSDRRLEARRGPRTGAGELLRAAAAPGARFQRSHRQRVRFRHRSRGFRPARRQRLHR